MNAISLHKSCCEIVENIQNEQSLLPLGEGYDCKDAGGRAKQEARAEDEGVKRVFFQTNPLTPALSLRERGARERSDLMATC